MVVLKPVFVVRGANQKPLMHIRMQDCELVSDADFQTIRNVVEYLIPARVGTSVQ